MKKTYLFFAADPDPKPDKKPERRDLEEAAIKSERPPQRPIPPTQTKPDKGSIKKNPDQD